VGIGIRYGFLSPELLSVFNFFLAIIL